MILFQIYPINIKGTAGSLVTSTHWSFAWIVVYVFKFMIAWSLAGNSKVAPHPPHIFTFTFQFHGFSVVTNHDYFGYDTSRTFHILSHLWFSCCVYCKAGTRDQGASTRRNSCIIYQSSAQKLKPLRHNKICSS